MIFHILHPPQASNRLRRQGMLDPDRFNHPRPLVSLLTFPCCERYRLAMLLLRREPTIT